MSPGIAPGVDLRVLPASDWAPAVAAELVARLRATPALRLCLPTGETPRPVYAELVAAEWRGDVSLAQATVVLLDEWVGLPPGDPVRGETFLRDHLLDQLREPPRFVAIDSEAVDVDAVVAAHDAAARDLDLAIVGLGINGHVGFNEPGTRPDDGTRLVRLAASSGETAVARYGASLRPTAGITIGMDRLLESHECWLIVDGARKADILHRALREPEGPDCPASYLRRHPRLVVFADEAAAARLG